MPYNQKDCHNYLYRKLKKDKNSKLFVLVFLPLSYHLKHTKEFIESQLIEMT